MSYIVTPLAARSPGVFPAHERRMGLRLLAYWEKLRAGHDMPPQAAFNHEDIKDLWDSCLMVHVKGLGDPNYQYSYLGPAIAGVLGGENSPGATSPHMARLTLCCTQIIASKKPLIDEGEFVNARGETVKYRQCLLPLGEAGEVQAIFGGMRFKIFPAK